MGILFFVLLIILAAIGCTQVISAMVIALATKNKKLREHFVYYLIGVVVYFVMMIPIEETVDVFGPVYFGIYFFLGAFGLMWFHFSAFSRKDIRNMKGRYGMDN